MHCCFACKNGRLTHTHIFYTSNARISEYDCPFKVSQLPVLQCQTCQEVYFGDEADRAIMRAAKDVKKIVRSYLRKRK